MLLLLLQVHRGIKQDAWDEEMYAGREELEETFEDGRSDTEVTAHDSESEEATQTDSDSDHDSDDIPETYNKVKKTGKTLPQLFVNSE
jgi:hypothetical protein